MQRQVVGSGEAALTVGTLERLHARVLAEVSCELVGARKLPCAALPHALVGFLTGVRPAVCLQVGALGVHLVAPGEVAAVDSPLLQCVGRLCGERVVCAGVDYH